MVQGGEVFPHLAPVNAAAFRLGEAPPPWKGENCQATTAAYWAKSELLLLVFEDSRALVLKLEWIRTPWSHVKLHISGAAPRFSDSVGLGWDPRTLHV